MWINEKNRQKKKTEKKNMVKIEEQRIGFAENRKE